MKTLMGMGIAMLVLFSGGAAVASDAIGVYGKIEKVTFLPDDKAPTHIKAEGLFARANLSSGHYFPAERGYMYFQLNKQYPTETRNEWYDFRKVEVQNAGAGGPFCIGFGVRRDPANFSQPHFNGTVRAATAPLASPDTYPIVGGAVRVGPEHHQCSQMK